ncbi:MAG: DUF72 domain-containing protein [candidate division Zixibacteria bacterium]|nr:DUF72 domain-containing protein [candidate division Zixibacteria bacterium]
MLPDDIHIGTSGFSYKDWLGNFYPQFCPQADFLRFYSSRFKVVEIDATFYRIPAETTVQKWAANTPDCFVFAAKFPQAVTHDGTLETRLESAVTFIEIMKKLGRKLGPLLMQFPYSFKPDQLALLAELVAAMPEDVRIAVELRNKAWLKIDALFELLKSRNMALALIDHPWMPRCKTATADFHYIRFLGDRKKIENDFSYVRFDRSEDLEWWTKVILEFAADGRKVFGFFNNHYSGHSPTTADLMIEILERSL